MNGEKLLFIVAAFPTFKTVNYKQLVVGGVVHDDSVVERAATFHLAKWGLLFDDVRNHVVVAVCVMT